MERSIAAMGQRAAELILEDIEAAKDNKPSVQHKIKESGEEK